MNIWQGNNNEKEVICPIIVLLVIDRKIDGKSRKSEMNRNNRLQVQFLFCCHE